MRIRRPFLNPLLALIAAALLAACRPTPAPAAATPPAANTAVPSPTLAPPASAPPPPTLTPPAAAVATAAATAVATAPPTPAPTPHPLFATTIAGLRARTFPSGPIEIRRILAQTDAYTQAAVAYPSDGLTITGLLFTPAGDGPFPVLILLHGYVDRSRYTAGTDSWQAADFFARRGYLVLAPDFRSWGESDSGLSLFHTGLVADVLHLLSALPPLPQADPGRVGLWGHSMGGGVATKVLAVDGRIAAAVLYAPNSADDADLIARWGPGCLPGQSEAAGDRCNPAEVIPPDTPPALVDAYLAAAADPAFLRQVAPIYHLDGIRAPLQIHIGTADGQALAETPPDWSTKLAAALEAANRDVDTYLYPDQGHFFTGDSWTTLLDRALAFFNTHLAAAP